MTKVIAHRGFSGKYPENTLLSFAKAIEAGADMLELDVHLTSDEEILVIHDLKLERTTDGIGLVHVYTLEELKGFNTAKLWPDLPFEPIPTLREVLELAHGKVQVNIELKDVAYHRRLPELVIEELSKWDDPDSFLISCFDHEVIAQLRKSWPQYACAILYVKESDPVAKAKAVDAQALHPAFGSIDESGIIEAHKAGLAVNVWTVNDPDTMERFLNWQVDGIISNYPDILLKLRR